MHAGLSQQGEPDLPSVHRSHDQVINRLCADKKRTRPTVLKDVALQPAQSPATTEDCQSEEKLATWWMSRPKILNF
jgi:hypothetical protein